jgi:hypothetical protein
MCLLTSELEPAEGSFIRLSYSYVHYIVLLSKFQLYTAHQTKM